MLTGVSHVDFAIILNFVSLIIVTLYLTLCFKLESPNLTILITLITIFYFSFIAYLYVTNISPGILWVFWYSILSTWVNKFCPSFDIKLHERGWG